jgi:hypothetical protein
MSRRIRLSRTFEIESNLLLQQGIPRFGRGVVEQKRDLIARTIEQFRLRHPVRPIDPVIGICAYPVAKTPFVLLYDYDDAELRIHLIVHASADRTAIDLSSVVW